MAHLKKIFFFKHPTFLQNLSKFLSEEARERGVEDAEAYLEKVLPELTDFCDYVRKFFVDAVGDKKASKEASNETGSDESESEEPSEPDEFSEDINLTFVGKALIEMTAYFDLSEEVLAWLGVAPREKS